MDPKPVNAFEPKDIKGFVIDDDDQDEKDENKQSSLKSPIPG